MSTPIRPTDDDARALAQDLVRTARFAALGVLDPGSGAPMVTRIACVPGPDGAPLSLLSDLSQHTKALKANPTCSLLIGEPGPKGDPLTHPRLSLQGHAEFFGPGSDMHTRLKPHYLTLYPKAKLYIGFADFSIMRLRICTGFLNGGFGKAFELTAQDMHIPS